MERPNFAEYDVPITDEQLRERETWMMTHGNWKVDHSIPSAGDHYRYMWRWDSTKAVVINARRGDASRAYRELRTLLRYEDTETGFIPNKIFATAPGKTWRDYPEVLNFNRPEIGTSYGQPPLEAWAVWETYEAYCRKGQFGTGVEVLEKLYGDPNSDTQSGLRGAYNYFINHRENGGGSSLIGIVHPNETGRDSDEASKPWLVNNPRDMSPQREWLNMQRFTRTVGQLGRSAVRTDWLPERVREKYWVNDVMFNVLYAQNMRYMGDIAELLAGRSGDDTKSEIYADDARYFYDKAADVDFEIRERMWSDKTGFFYNLDRDGNKIDVESITGLFPLLLDDIEDDQVVSLLGALEDEARFNTPYPLPTQSVSSRFYTPNPSGFKNQFTPQWSGPVWVDMNHLIAEEGLVKQADKFSVLRKRLIGRAAHIATKTHELLTLSPRSMEYYSPTDGHGMRVADFMWTNLGLHFEKTQHASKNL